MKKILFGMSIFLCVMMSNLAYIQSHAEESPTVEESQSIKIIIDGNLKKGNDVPIIVNGRTLLPLRELLVNLGVSNDDEHILWDNNEKSVTINKDDTKIILKIGSKNAVVNKGNIPLDVEPMIYKDKTYIPVRFVSQSMKKRVDWDSFSKSVIIGESDVFAKNKDLLKKINTAMRALDTYKVKADLSTTMLKSESNYKLDFTFDMKNKKLLFKLEQDLIKDMKYSEIEYLIGGTSYYKNSLFGDWKQRQVNSENFDNIFSVFCFLENSDYLYNGMRITQSLDQTELIIELDAFADNFGKTRLAYYFDGIVVNSSKITIVVDKENYTVKTISSELNADDYAAKTEYQFSDFNSEPDIVIPDDLIAQIGDSEKSYKDQILSEADNFMDNEKYDDAIKIYDKAIDSDPDFSEAYFGKALSLYYKGEYQKSIDAFDTVIKLSPDNNDAYLLQAKDYIYLKDYKKAVELCDYVIKIKSDLQYAHGIKGWALYWDGKLSEALTSLNEAIKLDPKYETAYIHKTGVLYYQKKYQDCIDFADTAIILFPKNVQFLWYKSDCYYDSLEYEKSAKQLEEALNIESENEEIIIAIARIYYGLQEYDKSNEYTQKALNLNKNNKSAIELQGYLQDQKLPEREKIASFVERNYLYKDKVKDFDVKTKSFKAGKDLSTAEVGKYISSIKLPDDQFTFFISGNDYDEIKKAEEENQVISKQITDDSYYLTFNSFTPKIHIQFKNIIDKIENPSEKNLIIDMRNNMGGLTYVSNEILDYLLPACVTSYTIYRDGEIRTVYSNEEQIKFKKIIILVNENTASSAELLSMGLKQYLNNVVIIGKPTVGKGVGQFVYEDKEKKYMIYLVSFYWNVREKNVSVQKITPDIKITGTLEKSYLDEVMKQIKK